MQHSLAGQSVPTIHVTTTSPKIMVSKGESPKSLFQAGEFDNSAILPFGKRLQKAIEAMAIKIC